MGILPLEYTDRDNRTTLGLTGEEDFRVTGIAGAVAPRMHAMVRRPTPRPAKRWTFKVSVRIDTPDEADYYRNGGILQYVLRQLLAK